MQQIDCDSEHHAICLDTVFADDLPEASIYFLNDVVSGETEPLARVPGLNRIQASRDECLIVTTNGVLMLRHSTTIENCFLSSIPILTLATGSLSAIRCKMPEESSGSKV